MMIIFAVVIGLAVLGVGLFVLVRWAQRKHLQEMVRSEGLLRQARSVRAAICLMENESEKLLDVDLYLSPKRICAFHSRSAFHPPLIHLPFENSALEVIFASSIDSEKRSYLGLGAPSRQGEFRFFLNNAREWLCDIERLNHLCSPQSCEKFDPDKCATTCLTSTESFEC
jgi:hypothetical protein